MRSSAPPPSGPRSHTGHSGACFSSAVCRRSVPLFLFRSLGQEAKGPPHTSTEYEPGPQVQGGASSGLLGVGNCKILQRYKKTLPWPIHSLPLTGTQEVLIYLSKECANKYPDLRVFLHSFPAFPSPRPTAGLPLLTPAAAP